jgi:DNA repair exonuclease SbcCD ATPase subunit
VRFVQCIATKGNLFNNTLLEFDPDVTILYGSSDTGKTLLLSAICDTLWGGVGIFKSSGNENLWSDFLLNIVIEHNNEKYRVVREAETYSITSLTDNITINQKHYTGEEFVIQLCETFPEFYNYTFAIGNDDFFKTSFAKSPVDDGDLLTDLSTVRSILLNDVSSYFSKFQNLEKFFEKGNINNQLIVITNRLSKELRESEREIEIRDIKQTRFGKMKNELELIQEEIDELNNKKENLNLLRDTVGKLDDIITQIHDLEQEIESYQTTLTSEKEKKGKVKKMETVIKRTYPRFLNIKRSTKVLNEIQKEFSKIQELISKRQSLIDKLSDSKKKNTKRVFIFSILSLTFFLGSAFVLPLVADEYSSTLSTLTPVIFGVVSLLFGIIYHFVLNKKYSIETVNSEIEEKFNILRQLLTRANIDTEGMESDELYELILHFFQEYDTFTEKKEELDSVNSSIDLENEKSIKDQIKANKDQIKNLEIRFNGLCAEFSLDGRRTDEFNSASEYSYIDQQLKQLNEEIEKNNQLKVEIKNEINRFSHTKESEDAVNENHIKIKTRHKKYREQLNSVYKIIELMRECTVKRESKIMDEFAEKGYKYYSELSGGKTSINSSKIYKQLMSGTKNFHFEKPSLKQIFTISTKLAFTDFVSPDKEPLPLILDEPGIYMDKKKQQILLKYIEEISQKRQIVVLTHDKEIYEKVGRLIEIS